MATNKKRSANKSVTKKAAKKRARRVGGGVVAMRSYKSRGGKVRTGSGTAAIAAALNRIESRVDRLEHNDAATYGLLLGMANASRKHHGHKPIKALPGFVQPRLYGERSGAQTARKVLGSKS